VGERQDARLQPRLRAGRERHRARGRAFLDEPRRRDAAPDHAPSAWQRGSLCGPSPDGKLVVFTRARAPRWRGEVFVVGIDGRNLRRLGQWPLGRPNAFEPAWSPDGRTILFDDHCEFGGQCGSSFESDFYVVRPDGTGRRRLNHVGGGPGAATWAPDGHSFVFVWQSKPGAVTELRTMRPDGTGIRPLTHAGDPHHPDWGAR
jgi:Tol biopolymer transport system component